MGCGRLRPPVTTSATSTGHRWVAVRPLRHRNFALVWSAALVSNVGTWMETVAVGDLVAGGTGEAGWTALVAAAGFLPMGLMGPIGGAIADRVDRRRFVFVTTLLQTLCAAALTALSATGAASPAAVAVVVAVAGSVAGIGFPAYQAMLPDLVPTEDLLGAVSLGQAQFNLGRVVGPAARRLGHRLRLLHHRLRPQHGLVRGDARRAGRPPAAAGPPPATARARSGAASAAGARASRREPGVRAAIVLISVVALTASPFIALIPAMARVRHHGGPALTSVFVTAQGVGAVVGALLVPVAGPAHRPSPAAHGRPRRPARRPSSSTASRPRPRRRPSALAGVGATYICVFSGLGTVVQLRAPAACGPGWSASTSSPSASLYPVGRHDPGPDRRPRRPRVGHRRCRRRAPGVRRPRLVLPAGLAAGPRRPRRLSRRRGPQPAPGPRRLIGGHYGGMRVGADHEVVDRRRIELVEPGVTAAPIHYESRHLDVAATAALVVQVRASAVRATSAALDDLAAALPEPIVSISLRTWPPDFPDDIAVQRRAPYEARADAIMYRKVLAEIAARPWLGGPPLPREGRRRAGGPPAGRAGRRGPAGSPGDAGAALDEGPSDRARRDDRGRLIPGGTGSMSKQRWPRAPRAGTMSPRPVPGGSRDHEGESRWAIVLRGHARSGARDRARAERYRMPTRAQPRGGRPHAVLAGTGRTAGPDPTPVRR